VDCSGLQNVADVFAAVADCSYCDAHVYTCMHACTYMYILVYIYKSIHIRIYSYVTCMCVCLSVMCSCLCVAVCCGVPQCVADTFVGGCALLLSGAQWCSVVQCGAGCCSVLQCVADTFFGSRRDSQVSCVC